jgi:GNAT superfamily N-acetyltransferase
VTDTRPRRLRMLARLSDVPAAPAPPALRAVRADDGPALGRLAMAAYSGGVDDPHEPSAWHIEDLTAALAGRYGRLLTPASAVVDADDGLAAAALFTWWDELPFLAFCLTHPARQGRGLATGLIAHAARSLAAEGHREVQLVVTETNPARALYERLGFRPTQRSQRRSGDVALG